MTPWHEIKTCGICGDRARLVHFFVFKNLVEGTESEQVRFACSPEHGSVIYAGYLKRTE